MKTKDQLRDLDMVLDFYVRQIDFVGNREVPVWFTKKGIEKFAKAITGQHDKYTYRGFTLVRLDPHSTNRVPRI